MIKKSLLITALLLSGASARAEMRWLGDVNNDGKVTIADLTLLLNMLQGKTEKPKLTTLLDVNQDGKFDRKDINLLSDIILEKAENKKVWMPDVIVVEPGKDDGGYD